MNERGLDDEKVAGRVGKTRETVNRWRNHQKRLDPEKIALLAHALDLEPAELYQPPSFQSLDRMIKNAPEAIRATAIDVIASLIKRAS